ncbi:hypothetical protein HK097_007770 [Rhizophlyctis rosea]|uniref:RGS domain-containing protein n=1 Tax=Rhizophlyctis rosea TaxID=64517 RepID=A0AAD5SD64_9FUNG|nr:hypothetical protein HK097_007770 [Rhizophlyctis rosea]
MARSLQFYFEYRVNQAKLFGQGAGPPASLSTEVFAPPSPRDSSTSQTFSPNAHNESMFDAEAAFGTTTTLPPVAYGHAGNGGAGHVVRPALMKAEDRLKGDFYWNHKGKVGNSTLWKIFGGVIAFDVLSLVIVQAYTPTFRIWPEIDVNWCVSNYEYFPMYVAIALYCVFVCPIILWKLRTVRDTRGHRTDMLMSVVGGLFCYIMFLVWNFIVPEDVWGKWWPRLLFHCMFMNIGHFASVILPVYQCIRDDRMLSSKHLLLNMESFMKVLNDPQLFQEFKNFTALGRLEYGFRPRLPHVENSILHNFTDFCVESPLFFEAYQELQVVAATVCSRTGLLPRGVSVHCSNIAASTVPTNFHHLKQRLGVLTISRRSSDHPRPSSILSSRRESSSPASIPASVTSPLHIAPSSAEEIATINGGGGSGGVNGNGGGGNGNGGAEEGVGWWEKAQREAGGLMF